MPSRELEAKKKLKNKICFKEDDETALRKLEDKSKQFSFDDLSYISRMKKLTPSDISVLYYSKPKELDANIITKRVSSIISVALNFRSQ